MFTHSVMFYLFFLVHSPATEIVIAGEKIIGRPIRAGVPIIENGVFLRPQDFVIVKGLIENSANVCDLVIDQALSLNEENIKRAHQECDARTLDNQTLIQMLTAQTDHLKEELTESKTQTQVLKYVAIGLGAVAVSTSAYIMVQ